MIFDVLKGKTFHIISKNIYTSMRVGTESGWGNIYTQQPHY
jgi:hypothetical protein